MVRKEIDDDERFMQCEKIPVGESLEHYAQHLRELSNNPDRSFSDFKKKEAEYISGFAFAKFLFSTSTPKSIGRALNELLR